ncbi:branched-chain amino acid transport system II carrier protein [Winogradskyella endarachnes]|uniref:Branched-chain amino acid transport system II carrier protein n=1 Tax=Winogradskyella endarachnes TaxID=2681965 RepID=A0A6L6UFW0_9FLAO|nr:branched-chain amino acid transport system II carrier protein [Winogradskyella endarachnes]MUU79842.1 branched-chain amino acid transport system II carrier protein [Winogradskyella endarachnes]
MNIKRKELLVTSFGLFSLFFGAGNLLIPPLLGYKAGNDWFLIALGFIITAVIIPILGILAHARLQGTLFDFGKKVSPTFSLIYCIIIYVIAVAIPSPRTAAATHEIAVFPAFDTSPLLTSAIYFSLVLVFVLNRSKILNLIGKFLTPFIVIMLLVVISIAMFSSEFNTGISQFETPIVTGILEGYQTFDAIGAVVVGAVIIVSLNFDNMAIEAYESKRKLIRKSGLIAGLGLFIIYAGLIAVGAYYSSEITVNGELSNDMQRANLLRAISISSLGKFGNTVLSILISLACFTTAIGIVAGTADYFKGLLNDSKMVYVITAILACVLGVGVGQLDFNSIIVVAVPVLLLIYPITIVLILLNVLPQKLASSLVFRVVVIITFLFSIPDVVGFISPSEALKSITSYIPFANYSLGWVLPAVISFFAISFIQNNKSFKK